MHQRGKPQIAADGLALVAIGLVTAAVALAFANRGLPIDAALADPPKLFAAQSVLSAIVFVVPGWYLATRAPRVMFGWILLAGAIGHGFGGAGWGYLMASEVGGHHFPLPWLGAALSGAGTGIEVPILAAIATFYPDGRRPRGWIGWLGIAAIAMGCIGTLTAFVDTFADLARNAASPLAGLHNPVGIAFLTRFDQGGVVWMAPSGIGASLVVVARWFTAKGEARRLLWWLLLAEIGGFAFAPLALLGSDYFMLSVQLPTILVLAALVAATLRHRVYGIEIVVSRLFVYVALLAVVGGAFGGVVVVAAMAGSSVNTGVAFVAAATAALILVPAKGRIEAAINRLLFGERDQPYAVLSRVAERLELSGATERLLPQFVEQVALALRLAYVAVEWDTDDGRQQVASGSRAASVERFALTHNGATIGALIAGHRAGERTFTAKEQDLFKDLARQASAAVANVVLTDDLARSRERIITTREEERRRLRRDLHDGLGPVLTGAAMLIDAGRNLMVDDPQAADAHLLDARAQVKSAIDDVRRLVYALRPPALDELGLVEAIRQQAQRGGMRVTVEAGGGVSELPAALEVAAFRIVSEAVTNAARHSTATECTVAISLNGALAIDIDDNGWTHGAWRPGVGLSSMRERAQELGGTCEAGPANDGHGQVRARIPVEAAP